MTVTVYRKTDASAPTYDGTIGSLCTLLDACLVNGYGAKSAAGWTINQTGTNKRAYLQGSGSSGRLLYVDDSVGTVYATVSGYYSATSITNLLYPFGAAASGYIYKLDSGGDWTLIANSKAFILLTLNSTWSNCWVPFFFGDITSYFPSDAGRCMIFGGPAAATAPAYSWSGSLTSSVTGQNSSPYFAGGLAGTTGDYTLLNVMSHNNGTAGLANLGVSPAYATDTKFPNTRWGNYFPIRRYQLILPSDYELTYGGSAITRGELPGWFFIGGVVPGYLASLAPYIANKQQYAPSSGPMNGKTFELYHLRATTGSIVGDYVHAFEISDTWNN